MKKHSWKISDTIIDGYIKHKVCRNCNLHRAMINSRWCWNETFYFELDTNANIIFGGEKTNRVPYGCGDKKPIPKFHLEDKLFEI